jgi:uncharacterized protein (TIGR02611 family)
MYNMDRIKRNGKKIGIGIAGGAVTLVGLLLVPYPGPGWLIVFAGLALLSREFEFAQKALDYAKGKYDAWTGWLKRRSRRCSKRLVIQRLWYFKFIIIIESGLANFATVSLIPVISRFSQIKTTSVLRLFLR